jgi:hypothetical protein
MTRMIALAALIALGLSSEPALPHPATVRNIVAIAQPTTSPDRLHRTKLS